MPYVFGERVKITVWNFSKRRLTDLNSNQYRVARKSLNLEAFVSYKEKRLIILIKRSV